MKRLTTFLDRLLLAVLGITLVTGGFMALAWHYRVGWVSTLLLRLDRQAVSRLPQQDWWHGTLIGVTVVSVLLGLFLLVGNVAPRRTHTLRLANSHPNADVNVDLDALALGVARELRTFRGVHRTRAHAIDDRRLPTISITVRAYPEIDVAGFTQVAEQAAQYVAYALDGARVAVRIQLHIESKPAAQTSVTTPETLANAERRPPLRVSAV